MLPRFLSIVYTLNLYPHPPREQALHQPLLLPVERVPLAAEQVQFAVAGVEDGGDAALFFD